MQYFIISVTALLVTTKSPKGCEDGFFTGYLVSLSLYSVFVFFALVVYSIVNALKLKTKYYYTFSYITMSLIMLFVLFNFLGNVFAGNDCGFYSVRGFAACLVTVCIIASFLIAILLVTFIGIFNRIFGLKSLELLA